MNQLENLGSPDGDACEERAVQQGSEPIEMSVIGGSPELRHSDFALAAQRIPADAVSRVLDRFRDKVILRHLERLEFQEWQLAKVAVPTSPFDASEYLTEFPKLDSVVTYSPRDNSAIDVSDLGGNDLGLLLDFGFEAFS